MNCSQCGNELKPGARFCTQCGQKASTQAFEVSQAGPIKVVTVKADKLDISNHEDFQTKLWELTDQGKPLVAVDMHNVSFIDSLAVGTLVGLNDDLRNKGGRIILAAVNENIGKILDMAGFRSMFEIHPTIDIVAAEYERKQKAADAKKAEESD